jgi:hypothetical protein
MMGWIVPAQWKRRRERKNLGIKEMVIEGRGRVSGFPVRALGMFRQRWWVACGGSILTYIHTHIHTVAQVFLLRETEERVDRSA